MVYVGHGGRERDKNCRERNSHKRHVTQGYIMGVSDFQDKVFGIAELFNCLLKRRI